MKPKISLQGFDQLGPEQHIREPFCPSCPQGRSGVRSRRCRYQVTVKLDCDEGAQPKGPRDQESNHQAIAEQRGAPKVRKPIQSQSDVTHPCQRPCVYLRGANARTRFELA